MNFFNINYCWGSLIVEELVRLGCDYFCIAPGSRSSPLTVSVAEHPKAKTMVHFDERGVAFHALGYASANKKPAVLICTSGTAAANFYPAIIEASKKKVPLIVLTADRPPELRQTGAVQTIDQVGLFGKYVKSFTDLPCPDLHIKPEFVFTTIDQAYYQATRHHGVVHINCMFREPLAPVKSRDNLSAYMKGVSAWVKSSKPFTQYSVSELSGLKEAKEIAERIHKIKNGLIVVGKVGLSDHSAICFLAEKLGWPILTDLSSGLRLGYRHSHLINYFDQALLSKRWNVDGIIHLGGRITSKRYYELIQPSKLKEYVMVLNHSLRNDPTHQVSLRVESSAENFCKSILPFLKKSSPGSLLKKLAKVNRKIDETIEIFLANNGRLNEIATARLVSQLIPKATGLFLSNSMPIRDMDFYGDFKGQPVLVGGNRGASGIDGIIASASGFAKGLNKPTTLMIGDLAALHDMNSLALLRDLSVPLVMVVLNNGGGGIFSFLPIVDQKNVFEKYFGTPHSYTLASVAAMFELNYHQPRDKEHFQEVYTRAFKTSTSTIIEVMTGRGDNLAVHKHLQDEIRRHIS